MDLEISIFVAVLLGIALLLLPLFALIHLFKSRMKGRAKLLWVLVIIFLPFLGSVLYFIMGKRYSKHNPE